MKGPEKCPLCGGAVEPDREIEELVREGGDVAIVRVRADRRCARADLAWR